MNIRIHRQLFYPVLFFTCLIAIIPLRLTLGQEDNEIQNRIAIEKMRDKELQPERILDLIGLQKGMIIGEAGAGHGYLTFKLSKRIGGTGMVYANDIETEVLGYIENKCRSENIMNITTVLGKVDDPLFPKSELDMVFVFDCLFEFSHPIEWMRNTKKYLKSAGILVIVDPNKGRFQRGDHFLTREQILSFASEAGYTPAGEVDDSFLNRHMIIVLKPEK